MENTTVNEEVSPTLQEYYDGLINKIQTTPVIDVKRNSLIANSTFITEKENFQSFLQYHQIGNIETDDSGFRVKRKELLAFFKLQQANKCLSITNCFGISKKIRNGGKFMLIQKGIFWKQNETLSVFKIINNIFKNRRGNVEFYQNFDLSKRIIKSKFEKFTLNLEKLYNQLQLKQVAHGYALPVDAMIDILENTDCLGNSEVIKISFGLKFPNPRPESLSSFTYYISDDDIQNAQFYIVCRKADGAAGDCPPEIPCKPSGGQTI